MKKLTYIFLIFISPYLFGQNRTAFNNLNIPEDSIIVLNQFSNYIDSIDQIIESTDKFILQNESSVELMAIIESASKPISLPDRQWPDDVTTSINVIRNDLGKITYYAEYPVSESGDWEIGYQHFIDGKTGQTLAFRRLANFFNSECTSGVTKESSIYYFSANKKLIGKKYSIVNAENRNLSKELCFFPYDIEYRIALTANELK